MTAYYNEFDPYAAQWLRNLIKAGHIAPGYVDERSIIDVKPEDLTEFTQCHFFAGIGVWSLALRNAGWSDDRPVWTGSCPCQPFSVAGKQRGKLDERHLAPVWLNLIQQQNPPVIFGEQVAGAISKHWLDDLFTELENESYACGAAVLPACSVGAPHKRERLFFGANKLADNNGRGCWQGGESGAMDAVPQYWENNVLPPEERNSYGSLANAASRDDNQHDGMHDEQQSAATTTGLCADSGAGTDNGFWSGADWLLCRDGKWRPVESGTFPLAHGVAQRVGRLRAYGNAIVPQAATVFIKAFSLAAED
ncbi:DNA cytosine methyltransferase [Rahnella bonaserana]